MPYNTPGQNTDERQEPHNQKPFFYERGGPHPRDNRARMHDPDGRAAGNCAVATFSEGPVVLARPACCKSTCRW